MDPNGAAPAASRLVSLAQAALVGAGISVAGYVLAFFSPIVGLWALALFALSLSALLLLKHPATDLSQLAQTIDSLPPSRKGCGRAVVVVTIVLLLLLAVVSFMLFLVPDVDRKQGGRVVAGAASLAWAGMLIVQDPDAYPTAKDRVQLVGAILAAAIGVIWFVEAMVLFWESLGR